jgi:hypothetical protein
MIAFYEKEKVNASYEYHWQVNNGSPLGAKYWDGKLSAFSMIINDLQSLLKNCS